MHLAELLHQAGHDVPPAPGLRLRAFKGENSWLLCEEYFSVLLSLTILQHGVCPPVHHDLGLPEQGVEAEEDLRQLHRILALLDDHLLAGVFLDLVFANLIKPPSASKSCAIIFCLLVSCWHFV